MAIRFQGWKRFLGLGAGVLLCATTGCMSDKEEKRIGQGPAPLNKPMGPGNTAMTTPPVSPAYNNLPGSSNVTTSQAALPSTMSQPSTLPSIPPMPTSGGGRQYSNGTISPPVNPMANPASFGQGSVVTTTESRKASATGAYPQGFNQPPAVSNFTPQPNYAMQQPVPGSPGMQVQPVMPQNPGMMNVNQGMMIPQQQQQVQPAMNVQPQQPQMQMQMQMPPSSSQMNGQLPSVQMNNQNVPMYNQQQMMQPQYQQPPQTLPGTYQNPPMMSVPTGNGPALMPPSNLQSRAPVEPRPASGVVQASASMPLTLPPDVSSPSMGLSAKSIASGPIKAPNDSSLNLPPDIIEPAPVTVIGR